MSACVTCGTETVQVRRKDSDAIILDSKPSAEYVIFDIFNDTVANATDVRGARSLEYLDQCEARLVAVWREHRCLTTEQASEEQLARRAGVGGPGFDPVAGDRVT